MGASVASGLSDAPSSSALRSRRVVRDFIASYMSKAATFLLSFAALPLVQRSLDVDEFAAFGSVFVLLTWAAVVNPMVGPAATVGLAYANGQASEHMVRVVVGTTAAFAFGVSLASAVIVWLWSPTIVGVRGLDRFIVAAASALFVGAAVVDLLRLGFQRASRNSVWNTVANLVGAATTFVLFLTKPTLGGFVAAVYLLPATIRLSAAVDLGPSLGLRRYLGRPDWQVARSQIGSNLLHLIFQITTFAGFPLAIVLFRGSSGSLEIGRLFVAQTISVTAIGLLSGAIQPFASAVSDARAVGDSVWIWKMLVRLAAVGCAIAGGGVLFLATVGTRVVEVLFQDAAPPFIVLCAISIGVGTSNVAMVMYQVLVGYERYARAMLSYLPGAALGVLFTVLGAARNSVELAVVGASVAPSGFAIPILVLAVRSVLGRAGTVNALDESRDS